MAHDDGRRIVQLIAELRRRKVFRVAAVYGALGFGLMQVADVMFPRVGLPDWTVTLIVWLILLGFPIAVVLAWAFETGPKGVHRTRATSPELVDVTADRPVRRRWPLAVAGLAGGILLVVGAWMSADHGVTGSTLADRPRAEPAPDGQVAPDGTDEHPVTVAVVAASSSSEDDTGEGLAGLLIRGLDDVVGIRSAPENLVLRAWEARDRALADSAAALNLAPSVGAHAAIVLASSTIAGPVRLHARIYPVQGAPVEKGSFRVQGDQDSLIALIDELAVRLVANLLPGEARSAASIAAISTPSLPAMQAFILGEQARRLGHLREATMHFDQSVQEDSTFALAWYRLQTVYGWSGELELSGEAGRHARLHADQLPAREQLIVNASNLVSSGGRLSEVEDAVRMNPDDWELLELLSEMYLHDAWRAGISPRVADSVRALAAAVVPDDPALLYHGIDLALGVTRDSTLANERIDRLRELDQDEARLYELKRDMVFGAGAVPEQDALLLALPDAAFAGFPYPFAHPLSTPGRIRVNRAIAGRDNVLWENLEPTYYTRVTLGHLEDAIASLATPDATRLARMVASRSKVCNAYLLEISGVDLAGTDAARWLSEARSDPEPLPETMLCIGGRAVDQGRWGEAERQVVRLREAAATADETTAAQARASASALEVYLRHVRDGTDETISRAIRLDASPGESWPIRWWTARMLSESGRQEEALGIYESFWFPAWVPAFLERAELSEQLGQVDEAARLYDVVLSVWADADAAFQPLVDRARAGRARLDAPST